MNRSWSPENSGRGGRVIGGKIIKGDMIGYLLEFKNYQNSNGTVQKGFTHEWHDQISICKSSSQLPVCSINNGECRALKEVVFKED